MSGSVLWLIIRIQGSTSTVFSGRANPEIVLVRIHRYHQSMNRANHFTANHVVLVNGRAHGQTLTPVRVISHQSCMFIFCPFDRVCCRGDDVECDELVDSGVPGQKNDDWAVDSHALEWERDDDDMVVCGS
ncbi:hypothetical protein FOXG_15874 [Fusarium oxysporum f. sp. lycopersici 4287]|nr:hypothetical protein FOXG_15874 [Fusarium oxysporum f. sp. lycopersici 4287]EXK26386.1 hypothetical protein FOMG_17000 [Fusarium oxysporum f. sp. melonis 26406]KNB18450.1 hypothetical protein FOXG_15874 [Fusarium oxysporum f. sp. lycopersici 4287]